MPHAHHDLRELIFRRGVSVAELARRLGVSRVYSSLLIHGSRPLRPKMRARILEAIGALPPEVYSREARLRIFGPHVVAVVDAQKEPG